MKKVINYSDLVLNTLSDTIKRENRYTIDNVDVMNYGKVIEEIIKYNGLDTKIGKLSNGDEFLKNIEDYVFRTEVDGKDTYTLLPWIDIRELDKHLENTIFSKENMNIVFGCTFNYLFCKRTFKDLSLLKQIELSVNRNLLETTNYNVIALEYEKNKEQEKLSKIKRKLNIGD